MSIHDSPDQGPLYGDNSHQPPPSRHDEKAIMKAVAAAGVAASLLFAMPARSRIHASPDPVGARVTVSRPANQIGMQVRVLDATGATDEQVAEGVASLVSGDIDSIIYDADPATACDNSSDCDRELKAACRQAGGTVDSTRIVAKRHQCDGTCSTGHAVAVVCVAP